MMIIIGIRVHMDVDLQAIESGRDFMKESLIHYAEDDKKKDTIDKENGKKSAQQHKHDKVSLLDVIHAAAMKKSKEWKKIAEKKAFDKLAGAGFVIHDRKTKTESTVNETVGHQKNRNRNEDFNGEIENLSLILKFILRVISNRCDFFFLVWYGVDPELAIHYQNKMEFKCIDSNKIFPINFVNDDYCDCDDGSDEPGTSACPNGRWGFFLYFSTLSHSKFHHFDY